MSATKVLYQPQPHEVVFSMSVSWHFWRKMERKSIISRKFFCGHWHVMYIPSHSLSLFLFPPSLLPCLLAPTFLPLTGLPWSDQTMNSRLPCLYLQLVFLKLIGKDRVHVKLSIRALNLVAQTGFELAFLLSPPTEWLRSQDWAIR